MLQFDRKVYFHNETGLFISAEALEGGVSLRSNQFVTDIFIPEEIWESMRESLAVVRLEDSNVPGFVWYWTIGEDFVTVVHENALSSVSIRIPATIWKEMSEKLGQEGADICGL